MGLSSQYSSRRGLRKISPYELDRFQHASVGSCQFTARHLIKSGVELSFNADSTYRSILGNFRIYNKYYNVFVGIWLVMNEGVIIQAASIWHTSLCCMREYTKNSVFFLLLCEIMPNYILNYNLIHLSNLATWILTVAFPCCFAATDTNNLFVSWASKGMWAQRCGILIYTYQHNFMLKLIGYK